MTLRILHISDIHVTNGRRPRVKEMFGRTPLPILNGFRSGGDANLHRLAEKAGSFADSGVAWCVMSGDLTADGHRDELERGATYIEGRHRSAIGGLGWGLAASMIWGNHDAWAGGLLRGTVSSRRRKRSIVAQHFPCSRSVRLTHRGQPFVSDGRLRIRAYQVDSVRWDPMNLFAVGRVRDDDLVQLGRAVHEDELEDEADTSVDLVLRVLVLHHPVEPRSKEGLLIALRNRAEVVQALRDLGFGLVLCGHEHSPHVGHVSGTDVLQVIAGTGAQRRVPNHLVSVEILPSPFPASWAIAKVSVYSSTRRATSEMVAETTHVLLRCADLT